MGIFDKFKKKNPSTQQADKVHVQCSKEAGVVPFEDFTLVLQMHLVDRLF